MIYTYFCESCDINVDIVKSMLEASRSEPCTRCGRMLNRVYTAPQIHMGTTTPNASVRNDMARYKDEHPGSEMAPTQDYKTPQLRKPKREYELSKADHDGIDRILQQA